MKECVSIIVCSIYDHVLLCVCERDCVSVTYVCVLSYEYDCIWLYVWLCVLVQYAVHSIIVYSIVSYVISLMIVLRVSEGR